MKVNLQLNKNINFNANFYFDKAKKLKKKIVGIDKTIIRTGLEIEKIEKNKNFHLEKLENKELIKKSIKKTWYENKFRYTFTSNGFLFVIGKDSTTNEILIKKHLEEGDLVFHTLASGSPFGILKKAENSDKLDKNEAAQFLACFSSSFKAGFGVCDVFYVKKKQVLFGAKSGEFKEKGSFLIEGEKKFIKNVELKISLGYYFEEIVIDDKKIKIGKIISGALSFINLKCDKKLIFAFDEQSKLKSLNKQIKKKIGFTVDELSYYLPVNCKIIKG